MAMFLFSVLIWPLAASEAVYESMYQSEVNNLLQSVKQAMDIRSNDFKNLKKSISDNWDEDDEFANRSSSINMAANSSLESAIYARADCSWMMPPRSRTLLYVCRPCRECAPSSKRFPLMVFQHGSMCVPEMYTGYMEMLARYGFVVAGNHGCIFSMPPKTWTSCRGGATSFKTVLNVVRLFQLHDGADVKRAPVDITQPVTAIGHSTGGRAVLMVAAVKNDPNYLNGTGIKVSPRLRDAADKISAVIAIFSDPMDDPRFNPDVSRWKAGASTPVMFVTGTRDVTERQYAGWDAFKTMRSYQKVYINFAEPGEDRGHLSPMMMHPSARWSAIFARGVGLGISSDLQVVYGTGSGSFQKEIPIARPGERNTGEGQYGMVLCGQGGVGNWPVQAAQQFCRV